MPQGVIKAGFDVHRKCGEACAGADGSKDALVLNRFVAIWELAGRAAMGAMRLIARAAIAEVVPEIVVHHGRRQIEELRDEFYNAPDSKSHLDIILIADIFLCADFSLKLGIGDGHGTQTHMAALFVIVYGRA